MRSETMTTKPAMYGGENPIREHFEERIFNYRFIQSIGAATPDEQRGVGMPLGVSRGCPSKAEFCRKDEGGNYLEPFVAGAWWAYASSALAAVKGEGE